jgi:hypothetical protein
LKEGQVFTLDKRFPDTRFKLGFEKSQVLKEELGFALDSSFPSPSLRLGFEERRAMFHHRLRVSQHKV